MEFFEGKRVRELRSTYEDALEKTLEPQTLEVRRDPPFRPAPRVGDRHPSTRGTTRGKMSPSTRVPLAANARVLTFPLLFPVA
jgi:hypothetical protein